MKLKKGNKVVVFENGRCLERGMPVTITGRNHEFYLAIDADGNGRQFNPSIFTFKRETRECP